MVVRKHVSGRRENDDNEKKRMTRSECDLRVIRGLLARHVPDREV
jgi:hypothetical protein